jgi:energy-coupling factor transporter ATP-binding protein EcfA2
MSGTIEVEGLTFRYHLAEALHGISFHIDHGEIIGLLGPNGAGKTTTLKILTGPLSPGTGSIRIGGFTLPDQRHFLGLLCLIPCGALAFTAEPSGAWIFTTLPMDRLRSYARGVYLSLWVPLVVAPHLCLLGPCLSFYGVTRGAMFVAFSASLVSTYLGLWFLAVDGLPFTSSFKPSRAELMRYGILVMVPLALIFGVIQWIIFPSILLVPAATLLLVFLSILLAHMGFARLVKEMCSSLEELRLGPPQIFKEVEPGF